MQFYCLQATHTLSNGVIFGAQPSFQSSVLEVMLKYDPIPSSRKFLVTLDLYSKDVETS